MDPGIIQVRNVIFVHFATANFVLILFYIFSKSRDGAQFKSCDCRAAPSYYAEWFSSFSSSALSLSVISLIVRLPIPTAPLSR